MSRIRLTQRLNLVLGAIVLLALIDAGFARHAAAERSQARTASLAYRAATTAVDRITRVLASQQSAAHGFVITATTDYLDEIHLDDTTIVAQRNLLSDVAGSDQAIGQALADVDRAIESWRTDGAEQEIAVRQTAGAQVASELVRAGRAQTLFTDLGSKLDALGQLITDRYDTSRAQVQTAYDQLVLIVGLTLIAVVAVAMMLALLLARWVRRPVNAFSASVRAVGAGHLERSITITGPPEFVQIARAVDGMRLRLVAEIARSTSTADQLAAANAELEAFTYSVSHDLRAPLRAIDGFSVALLEDAGDTLAEEPRRHVTRIRAATQRMAELIDDLLRLARVSRVAPTLTDVDVSALAESTVADIRHTAGGRPVVVTVEAGLHAVADPSLVRIVLENILGNAFKFTTGRPDAHIEVTGVGGCPHTLFTVSDNGAGFDQTYVAKLFAPFQRLHTEREFPGTGIGLATVARIIHRHGGEVTASGVVEHGARISFTLAPEIDREIAHAS